MIGSENISITPIKTPKDLAEKDFEKNISTHLRSAVNLYEGFSTHIGLATLSLVTSQALQSLSMSCQKRYTLPSNAKDLYPNHGVLLEDQKSRHVISGQNGEVLKVKNKQVRSGLREYAFDR